MMDGQEANEYVPDVVSSPGETLREVLEDRGLTAAELSDRIGVAERETDEILAGRRRITMRIAKRLESVLGVSRTFWIRLEETYQGFLGRSGGNRRKSLLLCPVSFAEANDFVHAHHRHHGRVVGHKFSIGLEQDQALVGVCMVGRPVARLLDNGRTLEVLRLCVVEGIKNGCSMLYGAAWRAAKALGYQRLITYTLKDEAGTSLTAAGWRVLYETKGGSWSRKNRPRRDRGPKGPKLLWEAP